LGLLPRPLSSTHAEIPRHSGHRWALSTTTGEWRQITDFGERAPFIARRVSWSSDGRSILAAVAEGDSDIVLLEGLPDVERR
jgi:hypothetical protein